QQSGEVVQAAGDLQVTRSEFLFPDRERSAIERFRLLQFSLSPIQQAEIVQRRGNAQIVLAETLGCLKRVVKEAFRRGVLLALVRLFASVIEAVPVVSRKWADLPEAGSAKHQCRRHPANEKSMHKDSSEDPCSAHRESTLRFLHTADNCRQTRSQQQDAG